MPRHSKDFAKSLVLAVFFLAVGALPATTQSPKPGTPIRPAIPLGLDLYMPIPEDNPLTAEKVALGRRLFFDPILSRDFTLSCASCHDPRRAFTDSLPVAVGVRGRHGTRNAPTLVNRAYGKAQFWDGRAASLEDRKRELWRISAEGGEPQKLELAMENLRDLRFHPDGRRIAFSGGKFSGEVWVMENFLPKAEVQAARLEE